jgi:hypothetical protein
MLLPSLRNWTPTQAADGVVYGGKRGLKSVDDWATQICERLTFM